MELGENLAMLNVLVKYVVDGFSLLSLVLFLRGED